MSEKNSMVYYAKGPNNVHQRRSKNTLAAKAAVMRQARGIHECEVRHGGHDADECAAQHKPPIPMRRVPRRVNEAADEKAGRAARYHADPCKMRQHVVSHAARLLRSPFLRVLSPSHCDAPPSTIVSVSQLYAPSRSTTLPRSSGPPPIIAPPLIGHFVTANCPMADTVDRLKDRPLPKNGEMGPKGDDSYLKRQWYCRKWVGAVAFVVGGAAHIPFFFLLHNRGANFFFFWMVFFWRGPFFLSLALSLSVFLSQRGPLKKPKRTRRGS